MKFRIAGIEYDVVKKSAGDMGGLIGCADFNHQIISINGDCTAQTQQIAVLHEVLHIIDAAFNVGLSEEQVKTLTHGVLAAIKDNGVILRELLLAP